MTKTGYLALVAVAALALYGCGGKTKTGAAATTGKTTATEKSAAEAKSPEASSAPKHEGSGGLGDVAKDVAGKAKEEAAKFANPTPGKCPVTGEPVESGVSVTVDGKTYGFCCKDCIDQFKEDPAKFLTAK